MHPFAARGDGLPPGAIIAIVATIGVGFFLWWLLQRYLAARHADAMRKVAETVSLRFDRHGDVNVLRQYLALNPIGDSSRNWILNHMRGSCQGAEIDVFERCFVMGSGRGSIEAYTTVGRVRCPGKAFPAFHLSDAASLNDVLKKIRAQHSIPFHEGWLFECVDEAAGRALFTPAQLAEIKRQGFLYFAGVGEWLYFYDTGDTVKPGAIPDFINKMVAAARVIDRPQ
jgi:hypothetical protein